ncbi:hypothetical protein [Nostoc sp. C117]|uniref:hypothetical protein n=1 Tax=Nostoc sp. C117 TaxID=3349875 RepID=UPI00370D5450
MRLLENVLATLKDLGTIFADVSEGNTEAATGVSSAVVDLNQRVKQSTGGAFDLRMLHTPLRDRIMIGITFMGDSVVMLIYSLGLAISPLFYNRRWQATILGIAGVGATLLNCLMKLLFGRARPALWKHIIPLLSLSEISK